MERMDVKNLLHRIPRPRRHYRTFAEKFGREVEFFGSRKRTPPPSYLKPLLCMGALFMGIVLCVGIFFVSTLFRVKAVTATPGRYYTAEVLVEASGVEAGDLTAAFDTAAVERRLKKALPLIETVRVSKRLDGTLSIKITEEEAVYYTCHNVNYYFIAADDRSVLGAMSTPDEAERVGAVYLGLPETAYVRVGEKVSFVNLPYAPESAPEELTTYEVETEEPTLEYAYVFEFLEALMASPLASRVKGMELSDRYDISFVLDGDVLVRVGDMKELDRKLTMVERSLENRRPDANGMNTLVDVSDPARTIHRTAPDVVMPAWVVDEGE